MILSARSRRPAVLYLLVPWVTVCALAVAGCASATLRPNAYSWSSTADLSAAAAAVVRPVAAAETHAEPTTREADVVRAVDGGQRDWIDGPVSIIATDEERELYGRLDDDADRRRFQELFWQRRDPAPADEVNEFRQEFERRVVAAELAYGVEERPGWANIFGRALVAFGYPRVVSIGARGRDDVELRRGELAIPAHPLGGDRVHWRYGPELESQQASSYRAAYADFLYSGGSWCLSCGQNLVYLARAATGTRGYGIDSDRNSTSGPAGGWETHRTAADVPGTGIPIIGAPMTHGESYLTPIGTITPGCADMMRLYLLQTLRNEVIYPNG